MIDCVWVDAHLQAEDSGKRNELVEGWEEGVGDAGLFLLLGSQTSFGIVGV